jgi:3-oxoacyl-[acyl-carrier-protein] synthase II
MTSLLFMNMPMDSSAPPHRVVITGAGIITSMGIGWAENAAGFRTGKLALRDVTVFDASAQRVQRAGEVVFDLPMPENKLTARQLSRMDRASRLLIHAGAEALQQSGWAEADLLGGSIPLCLGTSAGAMEVGEGYYKDKMAHPGGTQGLAEKVLLYQPHTQAQTLLDALGVNGPITIIANACASGANVIGQAFHLIKQGRTQRAIAGGYDALAHLVFAGFDSLQALSTTLPRPFDEHRNGLALGEGAGIVMLERYEDAVARGAEILAEVIGYGAATDLHHLTQPHPQGDAALMSMTRACAEAKVQPTEIDYINSHGTGTPLNDVAEGMAIQRWAADDVAKIKVSSTKASIGHLLGGAGAVETVICLLALKEGFLPPTSTIETLDPICTFDLVREPREARLEQVLTNSFGFGGSNATLILRGTGSLPEVHEKDRQAACHTHNQAGYATSQAGGVTITGWGAVSPAGWSAESLSQVMEAGSPLPFATGRRSEEALECRFRKVPALTTPPDWMKLPRFRRTTAAARHAVHAAVEALGPERLAKAQSGEWRVGVIFCTMNGCVQFSRRFYAEVLSNPLLASPILFPETVYNAPSSHISALLGSREINCTLVGDSAQFLRGMEMATHWLEDGLVEACLVVAAEEQDWLSDEGLLMFHRDGITAEGAAAVLLEKTDVKTEGAVRLQHLTEAFTYGQLMPRELAVQNVHDDLLKQADSKALLCHSRGMGTRVDKAEQSVWTDWQGDSLSVRDILGEGFSITAGWQVVAACEALQRGKHSRALINAIGLGQQAMGAILAK